MKNTFSLEAYFILKYLVQNNNTKSDQFYQKCHNSNSIAPMGLKFVYKFYRLIYIQLLCFEFCLEKPIRSSKIACKILFIMKHKSEIYYKNFLNSNHHAFMSMDLKSSLNHVLTYISMILR